MAGMQLPADHPDKPSRILSAQTKLSQGGSLSTVHSLPRNDKMMAPMHQQIPDDQVMPQHFYQPNVDVIYERNPNR